MTAADNDEEVSPTVEVIGTVVEGTFAVVVEVAKTVVG